MMILITSTTATAAKVAVRDLPTGLVPLVRFGTAGLVLLPIVWRSEAFRRMFRQDRGRLLLTAALCRADQPDLLPERHQARADDPRRPDLRGVPADRAGPGDGDRPGAAVVGAAAERPGEHGRRGRHRGREPRRPLARGARRAARRPARSLRRDLVGGLSDGRQAAGRAATARCRRWPGRSSSAPGSTCRSPR